MVFVRLHGQPLHLGNNPVKITGFANFLNQASASAVIKSDNSLIKLRVGGYNIAHARGEESGGLNEIGKPSKLKGIAQLVKRNKLDIIGFTEISKVTCGSCSRNQPKFIAEYLGFHHVYAQNFRRGHNSFWTS